MHGAPKVSETTYEYAGDHLVRSVTLTEPDWSEMDRALLLALLEEQAETCPSCGHLMSECRDPRTAGRWQVTEEVCQPSRVTQAAAESVNEAGKRGVLLKTRRTSSGGD